MASQSLLIFLLFSLAVWRLTHLLAAEDGPWELLVKLRKAVGEGFFGSLLDCFYCLSVWIAVPLAWIGGEGWRDRLLLWPALSAASILLERATDRGRDDRPVPYFEDDDVLLRR